LASLWLWVLQLPTVCRKAGSHVIFLETSLCEIGRWGGGRVWRQWAHWPASWSSWCSACNGVSIFIFTSTSSGCLHTDDCRPWKIKIHARSSEADGEAGGREGRRAAHACDIVGEPVAFRGDAEPLGVQLAV